MTSTSLIAVGSTVAAVGHTAYKHRGAVGQVMRIKQVGQECVEIVNGTKASQYLLDSLMKATGYDSSRVRIIGTAMIRKAGGYSAAVIRARVIDRATGEVLHRVNGTIVERTLDYANECSWTRGYLENPWIYASCNLVGRFLMNTSTNALYQYGMNRAEQIIREKYSAQMHDAAESIFDRIFKRVAMIPVQAGVTWAIGYATRTVWSYTSYSDEEQEKFNRYVKLGLTLTWALPAAAVGCKATYDVWKTRRRINRICNDVNNAVLVAMNIQSVILYPHNCEARARDMENSMDRIAPRIRDLVIQSAYGRAS